MKLSPAALRMLADLLDDGEPTDYADFANRSGIPAFGWSNRERCLEALLRKKLISDNLKLTDAGIAALGRNSPEPQCTPFADLLQGKSIFKKEG